MGILFKRKNGITKEKELIPHQNKIEKELIISKKTAERYLDLAGGIILSLDRNGNIILLNKMGCEILGYSHDEIIGRNWFELCLKPEIVPEIKEVFSKIMKGEVNQVKYYENEIVTKSGNTRLIAWHNTVLMDDDGNILELLSSGMDITDLKRTNQKLFDSELKFRDVFSISSDSISITRLSDGMLIDVNNGFCNITGYSREEVLGKTAKEINVWEDLGERKNLMELLKKDGVVTNMQINFKKKDGTIIPGLISASILKVDNILHIISYIKDISSIKKIENELKKAKETLEEEVDIKTEQLRLRVSELERFFDATVERELRMKDLQEELMALKQENKILEEKIEEKTGGLMDNRRINEDERRKSPEDRRKEKKIINENEKRSGKQDRRINETDRRKKEK